MHRYGFGARRGYQMLHFCNGCAAYHDLVTEFASRFARDASVYGSTRAQPKTTAYAKTATGCETSWGDKKGR